jgi:hypothetical protein
MNRLLPLAASAFLLAMSVEQAAAQQSPAGGVAGTTGGIRAVTRRTLMSGYNANAAAMMTAGGLNGFAAAPTGTGALLPGAGPAPVAAPQLAGGDSGTAPVTVRPEVRRQLELLARRGDPVAAAALAELRQTASAARP